jgi:plasmid stability protein
MRYCAFMATIQIREVPEDVHRTYRERAARAGQSLQEYLLSELTRNARTLMPSEVVAEVEARLRVEGPNGFATRSSARIIRRERTSH